MVNKTNRSNLETRHFYEIARAIQTMPNVYNQSGLYIDIREEMAKHFAHVFSENQNFNRARFLHLCLRPLYETSDGKTFVTWRAAKAHREKAYDAGASYMRIVER